MKPRVHIGLIRDDSGLTLTPEIAAACASVFRHLERMFNDEALMAKIDAQYLAGPLLRDVRGFDWYAEDPA